MTYDPLKDDSPANVIMLEVRRRKGLKAQPNVITGASCTLTAKLSCIALCFQVCYVLHPILLADVRGLVSAAEYEDKL